MSYDRSKYEKYAKAGDIDYEIVRADKPGLFGETLYQACTFQKVMRPTMERIVLGTFTSRADAVRRLDKELSASGQSQARSET